jgi:hypothetical protein
MKTVSWIVCLFALLLQHTAAQVLVPDAIYTLSTPGIATTNGFGTQVYSYGSMGTNDFATSIATIRPGSDPYMADSAVSGVLGSAEAQSELQYFFEIAPGPGGQSGVSVPVDFAANGVVTASGPVDVSEADGSFVTPNTSVTMATTGPAFFNFSDVEMLSSGTAYSVEMYLTAVTGDGRDNTTGESASGYIDPTIMIDSSFADAGDYSVQLSANLAPEPSVYALLVIGLSGLAFFRKFRTRSGDI